VTRLAIITALVAACASTPREPAAPPGGHMSREGPHAEARKVTHPEEGLTCEYEIPTGSNLERRRCRSDAEKEAGRKNLENIYLDPSARPLSN
jgi:hypothetical protein